MAELKDIDLLSLQTEFMKSDPVTQGFCSALDPKFKQIVDEVSLCLIYAGVDYASEAILDELAWQFNIDWYDPKSEIDIKRQTIKSAIQIHRTRGTPYAVEKIVKTYFGGDASIEEWFDYSGDPYYFRVRTSSSISNLSQLESFFNQVNIVKNIRSRLETVIIDRSTPLTSYIGMLVSCKDFIVLNTEAPV